ncbi:TetR/AcrR family transcriptional regulator [Verticiella sediminum]|uniref:TetR/AcrR family transcriptional regulator n=1 Tax=Verticiella sediminum TaxID=1247510 RepID=A0A556ARZ2_9BURK|nr:TetR/AcrR family transcriptional regulator [Verticiella sediminum]TSH95709.1 TetR/AcrR family transcriptional regulator [Verticiella sediminum]
MSKRRTQQDFHRELTALLCSCGICSLTIAEIAARLRCSRRRLYELAPTKEALFVGVCREVFAEKLAKGHAAAQREADPAQAIAVYLTATLNTSGLNPAAFKDLDEIPEGRRVFDEYQVQRMRGLEALLEDGMRAGVLAPHHPRVLSEALIGAAFRLRNRDLLEDTGLRLGDAFAEFYEIILHGLLRRP